MKTITKTVYNYAELSDDAKERAREWFLQEVAFYYDWWEFIYEDAERIGLKIEAFDCYRRSIKGDLLKSVGEVCQLILVNHGPTTNTGLLVRDYFERKHGGNPYTEDEFIHALLQEYLDILEQEMEFIESEESVAASMEANEYTFDKSGKREG